MQRRRLGKTGPGGDIVPVLGSRRRDQFAEAPGGIDATLGADDLAAIEAATPKDAVAGDRYAAFQMADLDSEKP